MRFTNLLFLLALFHFFSVSEAHSGSWDWSWSKEHNNYMPRNNASPYLENHRDLQIPQWDHEEWVSENWTAQYDNPMKMIEGFYKADIIRDQIFEGSDDERAVMVVGPNFYRLSGYDKRRVSHVIDVVYGITAQHKNNFFYLKDWNTKNYVGVFDQHGLRLH